MLLVESPKNDNQIVGFVQLGSLPPPPGFSTPAATATTAAPQNDDPVQALWNGVPINAPPRQSDDDEDDDDVPYIANLCVIPSYRKSGIGKKMVDICLRWLDKRDEDYDNVFIAVESNNFLAKRFYERIGFVSIIPPDKNKNSNSKGNNNKNPVASQRDYYYRSISKAN